MKYILYQLKLIVQINYHRLFSSEIKETEEVG